MSVQVTSLRSRNLLCIVFWIGVLSIVLGGADASAEPQTCDQLLTHPSIERAAAVTEGSAFRVIDLSKRSVVQTSLGQPDQHQAIADSFVAYDQSSQTLRVLALDLPKNAPLVEVTCAIGRRLHLNVDETLIVVTAFGMHAYSGSLTYQQLRVLARRHNGQVVSVPLTAAAKYATDILEHIRLQHTRRTQLLLLSLFSFMLGAIAFYALMRHPTSKSA